MNLTMSELLQEMFRSQTKFVRCEPNQLDISEDQLIQFETKSRQQKPLLDKRG